MRLHNTTGAEDEELTNCQDPEAIAAIAERLDSLLMQSLQDCNALEEEVKAQKAAFAAICEQRDAATEALENLENDDGAIPHSAWEMVQAAITDAGGTPKGPPETDIRAENAALRQSLAWAMANLRKAAEYQDRGSAAVCWDAIQSDRGYVSRLLAKAITMTAEDEPKHIDQAAELATALIEQPLLERIAALRASLAWAITTLQGESGCGGNFWEKFPEYVAARALLAEADVQPKEETP